MKTAAIINDFNIVGIGEKALFSGIRARTGADQIVAVMNGDFTETGLPAVKDRYIRAKELIRSGADLAVELPVYCTWMSGDGQAFAAVALLEKMGCIDELILPFVTEDENFVEKLVRLFFEEPAVYQKEFKRLRAQGCSICEAQIGAGEKCIPGAGDFLSYPVNLLTVELAKSLKKFYSSITPVFYFMAEGPHQEILPTPGSGTRIDWDDALGSLIMEKLYEMSPKDRENKLNDIYGGYEADTKRILSFLPEKGEALSFRKFSQDISTRKKTEEDMRCYLLRFLLDFRGMDNSICGLYTYILYIRILGMGENAGELLEVLKKSSRLPVFSEDIPADIVKNSHELKDECKEKLVLFDYKAHELYRKIKEGSLKN